MNASPESKRLGLAPEMAVPSQKDTLPRLDARRLFAASREVIIEHEGSDYRLRLTANGKLILTK